MISIAICEDEQKDRKNISDMLEREFFKYDDVEFKYYKSGEELIHAVEEGSFDAVLLILDIHMGETDGIDVARYIRENQVDVDIIFVTVSTEHVFDGYTYQAFSYLLKPVDKVRLSDEIARYMEAKDNRSDCLHVNIGGRKEQVFLDKVLYFVGEGRKVYICEKGDEQRSFYAKMGDLEQMLRDYDFIRCHQSYLVNKKYIKTYTRTELGLDTETIPVSRKYAESVRTECAQYFGEKLG